MLQWERFNYLNKSHMLQKIDVTAPIEQIPAIEQVKRKLNPLLLEFIRERYQTPMSQEKKHIFFAAFDFLSPREKIEYKNFVRNVVIDMKEQLSIEPKNDETENNDDVLQLQEILWDMAKIDKYEIYAWVLNHSQNNSVPEIVSEPNFFITWGSISGKWENINIGSVHYPKLNQFNSQGEYELELDIYLPNLKTEMAGNKNIPTKFIISKNPTTWEYTIYNQDRIKETSLKAKNGILQFTIPKIQRTFTLQVKE